MSATAALKSKPGEHKDKTGKASKAEATPEVSAGLPAFMGGIATGGAPAFLQRALAGTPEISEEEQLPVEGAIQRLPHDPFPSNGDDDESVDDNAVAVQAKLEINTPGDAYEQEADRVADAVMAGGSNPSTQGDVSAGAAPPSVQRKCAACGSDTQEEGSCPNCDGAVQRKESGGATPRPTRSLADTVSKPGTGDPIPDTSRGPIEAELGQDLSHVRVHQGPDAAAAASSIGAKAFTHGDHIWLGPGQSANDTALMAHEATHTVQQSGGSASPSLIQRAPADHQHPEDGTAPLGRMEAEIEDAEENDDGGDWEEGDPVPAVDQSERQATAGPLVSDAKPDVDRPAEEGPKVEQASNEVKSEADSPTEQLVDGQAEEPDAEASETEEQPEIADPMGEAVAEAEAIPEPEAPAPVELPPIAQPVDGDGEALPTDPESEAMAHVAAAQLQLSRDAAFALRQKAHQQRANAIILRGNRELVDQHVGEAETGLTTAHGHMVVRREAISEADNAHATSEEKADTVTAEAPGIQAEAEEAEGESGPIASESSDSAAQAEANKPDDEEGAEKSGETSDQMSSVSGDSASMDQASTATKQRAIELQADAAQAKERNTEARAAIEGATASADQTDTKLTEMDGQAAQARGEVDALAGTPEAAEAEAIRLDEAALAADQRVDTLAAQLLQAQSQYESDMRRVPGSETLAEENQGQIQRTADPSATPCLDARNNPAPAQPDAPSGPQTGYSGRRSVTLPTFDMGPALTEEQCQKQQEAQRKAAEKRAARIRAIQDGAYGNFDEMDGWDKAGLAVDFMLEDAFSSVGNIKWPDFSWNSAGKALLNIIDPRGPLNGIMGGLSMIASGGLNLFDMDQWSRDPLGNLLKSAADIATGITVILGSITALLGVITAISAAIGVLMFWVPPVSAAAFSVMSWCASAGITVGGWTISVGLLALYYQGLLIIKNIVDVMTAETAEDLVQNTEQLGEDFSQVGNISMQMGTAAMSMMGGRLPAKPPPSVMGRIMLEEVGEGLKDAGREYFLGEDIAGVYNIYRMGRQVGGGLRSGGDGGSYSGGDGPAAPGGGGGSTARADAGGDGGAPRSESSTPDASPSNAGDSPPPTGAPTVDAPTPNNQIPATDGPAPNLVEGQAPQPSQPMDVSPSGPSQPRSDAGSDTDASARSDEASADGAPPSQGSEASGGGARNEGGEAPSQMPDAPRGDTDGGGASNRDGADGGGARADEGSSPRPDEVTPPRSEGEGDATNRQDGADAGNPRAADGDAAALRQSSGNKKADEMSPAELKAEADAANSGPREDIGHEGLRDQGFDNKTRLDNDMDYIRSSEEGVACRISNTKCGKTNDDGTIPEEGLNGNPQQEAEVDGALAEGGEGTGQRPTEPESETISPTQDGSDGATQTPNVDGDGGSTTGKRKREEESDGTQHQDGEGETTQPAQDAEGANAATPTPASSGLSPAREAEIRATTSAGKDGTVPRIEPTPGREHKTSGSGSLEHKTRRWNDYRRDVQAGNKKSDYTYETWSNKYDANMRNSTDATAEAARYGDAELARAQQEAGREVDMDRSGNEVTQHLAGEPPRRQPGESDADFAARQQQYERDRAAVEAEVIAVFRQLEADKKGANGKSFQPVPIRDVVADPTQRRPDTTIVSRGDNDPIPLLPQRRQIEYKAGRTDRNDKILMEVARDIVLSRRGHDIEWVIGPNGHLSGPLRKVLEDNMITVRPSEGTAE